jgi:hypothetical protein
MSRRPGYLASPVGLTQAQLEAACGGWQHAAAVMGHARGRAAQRRRGPAEDVGYSLHVFTAKPEGPAPRRAPRQHRWQVHRGS